MRDETETLLWDLENRGGFYRHRESIRTFTRRAIECTFQNDLPQEFRNCLAELDGIAFSRRDRILEIRVHAYAEANRLAAAIPTRAAYYKQVAFIIGLMTNQMENDNEIEETVGWLIQELSSEDVNDEALVNIFHDVFRDSRPAM